MFGGRLFLSNYRKRIEFHYMGTQIQSFSFSVKRTFTPSHKECMFSRHQMMHFHSTRISLSKSKKSQSKTKSEEDIEVAVKLPEIHFYDTQMERRIAKLIQELVRLRGGRVGNDMFNHITVDAYGSRLSIVDAGQITVKSPTKLLVSVFDPLLVQAVSKAISDDNSNLNPVVDGSNVEVVIPKPSKEVRESIVKSAAKACEKTKTEIRQIRKQAMDDIKALKASISEDDSKRLTKEFETLTERKITKIAGLLAEKEKEIMQT